MGRKKISIKQIADPKLRHITFNKRKNGLIKKAAELSLLCNVNMLLVFEDGAGNLVQFSKNKISSLNAFFQECKYNKIIELTSKEYPNFFKVNHYKKNKYPDGEGPEENDDDSSDNNNGEVYGFPSMETKQENPKNIIKDTKTRESDLKKEVSQQMNTFVAANAKSELTNMIDNERQAMMGGNGLIQDPNKKPKPKQNLRLNVPAKPEDVAKMQGKIQNGENNAKMAPVPGELNEGPYGAYNQYKKDNFQEEQMKQINEKNMEYNASTFITPNIDPAKRLNGVPDPINSPFNFYPSNGRLRPFNNYGLGAFGNEEAFNNILKSYSPFGFPMAGNPQFMGKPGNNGEIDEKLFDHTKMLNYFNQAGSTPMGRQGMFNFPPNEFQKISINDAMRQGNNRNEQEYYNNYAEEPHDEMPPVYKGDPRFETNLPPANMSNRRYNSDAYFNNGFEEDYGAERQKKMKHN